MFIRNKLVVMLALSYTAVLAILFSRLDIVDIHSDSDYASKLFILYFKQLIKRRDSNKESFQYFFDFL